MAFSIDSQLHPHLTPYLEGDDGDLIALVIKEPRPELGDGRPPVSCIVGPNPNSYLGIWLSGKSTSGGGS